jgi:hypothetical protein
MTNRRKLKIHESESDSQSVGKKQNPTNKGNNVVPHSKRKFRKNSDN